MKKELKKIKEAIISLAINFEEGNISNAKEDVIFELDLKYHHYYCKDCKNKFAGYVLLCPSCDSENVGIDDVIIGSPKSK